VLLIFCLNIYISICILGSVDYAKLKLLLNFFTLEINSSNLKRVTGVFVRCSNFVTFVFREEASILLLFFHVFFESSKCFV